MPLDLLSRCQRVFRVRFREIALEVGVSDDFVEIRAGSGVAQERFGEEQNKRFPEITMNLATENVVLGIRSVQRQSHSHGKHT